MTTARLDALKWQLEEYGGGLPTSECRELIVALETALARAERAEKALDQAIRRANLYAENELEDSDLRAAKHEVNQMLVVWNSRDDYKDLNAYLRARENQ